MKHFLEYPLKTTSETFDALDLAFASTTRLQQNHHRVAPSHFKTQSTALVNQLFNRKPPFAGAQLISPSVSKDNYPLHFIPPMTGHSVLNPKDLPALYSDLITKILRQEDRKASFEQISTEFSYIEPVHYECIGQTYEIVFRVWYNKTPQQRSSRLLYIGSQTHAIRDAALFYRVFGHIDLALIPKTPDFYHEINLNWIENPPPEVLCQLSMDTLIRLSKYFDHGQSLNLRTLDHIMPRHRIQQALFKHTDDAWRQHLSDYYQHQQSAPNAPSLSYFPRSEHATHLTKFKTEILRSGIISTSNGGCLGNVIYSVKVLKDHDGQEYMGGMSLGLTARLYSNTVLDQEQIFLLSIKEQKNFLSNWINSFGFGRLKLEAMLHIAKKPSYSLILHHACLESLFLYERIRPLLMHFKTYSAKRAWIDALSTAQKNHIITMEFKIFWDLFTATRKFYDSQGALRHVCLLNNLLFETLKDYILLHQTTHDQSLFNELGSYDMHNQYQFFFAVDPDLKDKGFKTEFFSPQYERIIEQLTQHHALHHHHAADEVHLKKFLLDRFSAAINLFFLEHQNVPHIVPRPDKHHGIHPFIQHALILPNLFGNIIHSVLSKTQYPSPRGKKLITEYHKHLRQEYDLSYDERNITIPIKSNLFETDEIGVRQLESTRVHNIQLKETQASLYQITSISEPLPLQLKGVSERVQLRAKECEMPKIDVCQEIFFLITIKNDRAAYEKLNDFSRQEGQSPHQFMNTLLSEAQKRGELYHLSLLYFSVRHVFDSETLEANVVAKIISDVHYFAHTRDAKVKTLLTQLIIYLTRRQYMDGTTLLFEILSCEQRKEHNKNLDIYHEIAHFVRFSWRSLNLSMTILYTQAFLEDLSTQPTLDSVALVLANLSSLRSLRSLFITRLVGDHPWIQRLHDIPIPSMRMINTNLTILFNLSRGTFTQKEPLWQAIEAFLLFSLTSYPRLSHKVFTIMDQFTEVMDASFIKTLVQQVEQVMIDQPQVVHTLSFFFEKIEHWSQKIGPLTKNTPLFLTHELMAEILSHMAVAFISASCSFYHYDEGILKNTIKIILERLKNPETPHISDLKALHRLLTKTPHTTFFLNENGLQTMLSIGAHLQFHAARPAHHHRLACALLDILIHCRHQPFIVVHDDTDGYVMNLSDSNSGTDVLVLNDIDLDHLSTFYDNLLQETDLVGNFTAFILAFDVEMIVQKLNASRSNTESQIAILTGLSEVEITDEILHRIQTSALCVTTGAIIDEYQQLHEDLCQIIIRVIVNFYCRTALREQNPFHEQLHRLRIDPAYDRDLDADWQNILYNRPEEIVFDPAKTYYASLIASQHALNELPLTRKNHLIDEVIELCGQIGHPLHGAALILLEKCARNKCYSALLLTPDRLSRLTNQLQQLSEEAIQVGIIDAYFWLTVNHHQHNECILQTGVLSILLNHLIGNQASDELIRAILGLLVNFEFTDDDTQSLLPLIDLFIDFLKSQHIKVIINTLALLENILCVPLAWTYLDEENSVQFYNLLHDLQQQAALTPDAEHNEMHALTQSLLEKLHHDKKHLLKYNVLFEKRRHHDHKPTFKRLTSQVELINRFGLPFLTYHPDIMYKRMKYLPELVAHLPQEDIYQRCLKGQDSSTYTETHYLSTKDAELYRLVIKDGLIFSYHDQEHPYSCAKADVMIALSPQGNLYSAKKINRLQHTSFTAGGYLLFAGYWHVHAGIIQSIHAESGHYEPSPVALQNFVYLLFNAHCDLARTQFFHTDRKLMAHPTETLNFIKTEQTYELHRLLTPQIIEPDPSEAVSFITPKALHCLSQRSFFAQKIVDHFTNASVAYRGPA